MAKKLAYLLGLVAIAAFFLAPVLYSQSDMTHVIDPAFESKQRPASVFPHDEHNILAGIEYDCYICHHFDGTDLDPTDMMGSVGIPCSDCHPAQTDDPGVTPLMQAYHLQCKGCHMEEAAGPIACGECHVRPGP